MCHLFRGVKVGQDPVLEPVRKPGHEPMHEVWEDVKKLDVHQGRLEILLPTVNQVPLLPLSTGFKDLGLRLG